MRIVEYDIINNDESHAALIQNLFQKKAAGYVLRNFLSPEDLNLIKSKNSKFSKQKFEPSGGYTALPRPFGGVLGEEKLFAGYPEEIDFFKGDRDFKSFEQRFKKLINKVQAKSEITFAEDSDNVSFSNAWFSIRELLPEKGSFDIHCGNYFIDWNDEYFKKNNQKLKAYEHLAFLVMVQHPKSQVDLIIYDADWDTYKERKDLETLRNVSGEDVRLEDIPAAKISLNAGDIVLFNESNYWHQVPTFKGETNRITFGGFISKFKEENNYYFWA